MAPKQGGMRDQRIKQSTLTEEEQRIRQTIKKIFRMHKKNMEETQLYQIDRDMVNPGFIKL